MNKVKYWIGGIGTLFVTSRLNSCPILKKRTVIMALKQQIRGL